MRRPGNMGGGQEEVEGTVLRGVGGRAAGAWTVSGAQLHGAAGSLVKRGSGYSHEEGFAL